MRISQKRCFYLRKDGSTLGLPIRELSDAPYWWAYAPLKSGDVGAPPGREWCVLASSLRACGYGVTLLGGSKDDAEPGPDDVAGIELDIGAGRHPRVKLMSGLALGDLPPDVADALGVGSAAAMGARLALQALGYEAPRDEDGRERPPPKLPEAVERIARDAVYAGPMGIYRGATSGPTLYLDQYRAHLGAWAFPFPSFRGKERMKWLFTETAREAMLYVRQMWPGFIRARVRQYGEPMIPAHEYGGIVDYPIQGESDVCCATWLLAMAEKAGCAEVIEVYEACFRPPADAGESKATTPGDKFLSLWRENGAYKSVYQRAGTALIPRPRWHGQMGRAGIVWTQKPPSPFAYAPIGSLIISATGARTALAVYQLAEAGYDVAAAHVDAVIVGHESPVGYGPEWAPDAEAAREQWNGVRAVLGAPLPSRDSDCAPGDWRVKLAAGASRFYAPGRWDVGPVSARMGGDGGAATPSDFLTKRMWTADPRMDRLAGSAPIRADRR